MLAIVYLSYAVLRLPYLYRLWIELNRELHAHRAAMNDQLRAAKESRRAANAIAPEDGREKD